MTIYSWLIITSWIIFFGYWIFSYFTEHRSNPHMWHRLGLRVLIIVSFFLLFQAQITNRLEVLYSESLIYVIINTLGVLLCMVGIGYAIWARVHMGHSWGRPMLNKKETNLVTSGPYAYSRHPIYSGVLLATFGSGLVVGVWFIIFIIYSIYFIFCAKTEEKIMMEKFPEEYSEYKKRTHMFIPFIF